MDKILGRLTQKMVDHGTIDKADESIYLFGLHQGIMLFLNIITTIIIGALFNMLWESIFLMAAYIPVRSYAGGYHARTELRCYMISIFLLMVMLWMVHILYENIYILLAMFLLAACTIYMLSPIADENKPLDELEVVVYRKRARILLGIEGILFVFFIAFHFNIAASCIAVALFGLTFMLWIGVVKQKKQAV